MDRPKLLIVEDDEAIRSQMKWALAGDYDVGVAGDRPEALEWMRKESPSMVLLDLGLPPFPRTAEEGFRCLKELVRLNATAKIVVITGNQEKENAYRAIEQGAFDYFLKPAEMQEVLGVLKRAHNIAMLERERAMAREDLAREGFEEIIGTSPQMKQIFQMIRKVSSTDAPVLIEGESGTGKEMIAKAIHRMSEGGKSGPFIAINCGAIPENLLESELFGHEKGSFTGADAQRKGKIEYAAGGSLFLDEIGELPLLLQVKILRFLQEYSIERVGGRETIRVNVRVVAATNRSLEKEILEGRFREDLYYRLGVVAIRVPSLRERGEDVALLASHFLKKTSAQYGKAAKSLSPESWEAIRSYAWPGNVRELENKIRRAVIMSEEKTLTPQDLNLLSASRETPRMDTLKDVRSQVERDHILRVLERHGWNITRASKDLDISRPTLHDLMKRYEIKK